VYKRRRAIGAAKCSAVNRVRMSLTPPAPNRLRYPGGGCSRKAQSVFPGPLSPSCPPQKRALNSDTFTSICCRLEVWWPMANIIFAACSYGCPLSGGPFLSQFGVACVMRAQFRWDPFCRNRQNIRTPGFGQFSTLRSVKVRTGHPSRNRK
jgi:hypothetical protein